MYVMYVTITHVSHGESTFARSVINLKCYHHWIAQGINCTVGCKRELQDAYSGINKNVLRRNIESFDKRYRKKTETKSDDLSEQTPMAAKLSRGRRNVALGTFKPRYLDLWLLPTLSAVLESLEVVSVDDNLRSPRENAATSDSFREWSSRGTILELARRCAVFAPEIII